MFFLIGQQGEMASFHKANYNPIGGLVTPMVDW